MVGDACRIRIHRAGLNSVIYNSTIRINDSATANSKAKMKILIIEDEQPAAKKLIRLLTETEYNIEIAGIIGSVESAVNWLYSHTPPELIFMDIQLKDGLCFEIF